MNEELRTHIVCTRITKADLERLDKIRKVENLSRSEVLFRLVRSLPKPKKAN